MRFDRRRTRIRTRRTIAIGVVVLQLVVVVRAYDADHAFFGFQMFPETSEWSAEIVRVDDRGVEHSIRDPWPGGYEWNQLVVGRGLAHPWNTHPADAGIRSTMHFLDAALDWVAAHTPDDDETIRLIARVVYTRNGRGPFERTLESGSR